jgi:RNA polymerase sigma factor (sigma-70 family)
MSWDALRHFALLGIPLHQYISPDVALLRAVLQFSGSAQLEGLVRQNSPRLASQRGRGYVCGSSLTRKSEPANDFRIVKESPDRLAAERLFLEQLPAIERVVGALCRRHGLSGDDAEEFASMTRLKLIEDDYAVIRKFRGGSSLPTYLTVVAARLLQEHRIARWGRWRPSAESRRRGSVAIRLETMVRRDGLRLDEAAERLRTTGETALSDRELAALLAELPERPPLRPVEVAADLVPEAAALAQADDFVEREERAREQHDAQAALHEALAELNPEEQVIVRMRFWEGLSVADAARALGHDQKPLYRRLERALEQLRAHLERRGLSRGDVMTLLEGVV